MAEPTPKVAREPTPKPATEATSAKHKKSKLKLQQNFINEIIADEKDINNGIFSNYFKYQKPSFLVKDLINAKQNKNEKLVNNINNGLIDLRNDSNMKEIPENENPEKVAEKSLTLIKNKMVKELEY